MAEFLLCDQTIQSGETAMHRALFCQDIVEAIFGHLLLNPAVYRSHDHFVRDHHNKAEEREHRHALASAARVSKAISEIALSILWSQLPTFRHLVRLLPQYDSVLARLDGRPTESDWETFEKYARLVREARIGSVIDSDRNLWKVILGRYQSISRVFPRLTALETFHYTLAEDALFAHSLLTPTLEHISIDLDFAGYPEPPNGAALLTAALEHVADAVPSLASLTICSVSSASQNQSTTFKVPAFGSIQRLYITHRLTLDATMLRTIGQFEHLHALSIHIIEDCEHLRGCLQALAKLRIDGCATNIQSFLTATSPPHLQSLDIAFLHDPSADTVLKCLSALPTLVPHTLSALTLQSQLPFTPKLASVMDLLQPVLVFHQFTYFSLALVPLPSISDSHIASMASAWPALTTLSIKHDRGNVTHWHALRPEAQPKPARPTTRAFPIIAARCPHLRTLELPDVDLTALDSLPPERLDHPLRTLDLHSDCKFRFRHECALAAEMLDRVFPSLRLPAIGPSPTNRGGLFSEREEKGWDAVVRVLHEMWAKRRREREDGLERVSP